MTVLSLGLANSSIQKEYIGFWHTSLGGAGFLRGIGFTMSIFITLLAFKVPYIVNNSKFAILIASFVAGITGYIILMMALKEG